MPYCDHLLELQLNPIQDTPTYFCKNQQCAAPLSQCCRSFLPKGSLKLKKKSTYNSYLVNKWKRSFTLSQAPTFVFAHKAWMQQLFSFCDNVRFSSHSSTTREHCLCQRLESEVHEGHFTVKIKMKQRHESSHCAKNCSRQEQKMVGAKNRSAERLNMVTCPKKK